MTASNGSLGLFLGWAISLSFCSAALANEPSRAHHELRLLVDPSQAKVVVKDRITVRGRQKVSLKLANWLNITDVRVDGQVVQLDDAFLGGTISLSTAGTHSIELTAQGVIPEASDGRSTSQPFAGSDSIYLPGWSRWFPAVSDEPVTFDLAITTPGSYRAVATGIVKSEELAERENTSMFGSPIPMEPPSVFVGPYTVAEKTFGAARIRTYFYNGDARLAQDYLESANRYISMFDNEIGRYPFADFHIVAAPLPVGLGFPSLTYVDRRILRLPFMRGRSLAHEVLHNWWGNGIQPSYASGNWSEGLTTYMADHGLAEERGQQTAEEMRLGWLRDFSALPEERDLPVTSFVAKQHDASHVIGYGKVALIFHMLKQEIGPGPFAAAIKHFWQKYKFQSAGWNDIRSTVKHVTGSDYGWFFDQWTERTGAPRLIIEDARVFRRGDQYVLKLSLSQDAPSYRLRVPVHVGTDAAVEKFNIRLTERTTSTELQLDAKPTNIQVDPKHDLFRRLLPGEAPPIFRDVLLDNSAETLVLHQTSSSQQLARTLASRLFQGTPQFIDDSKSKNLISKPLLVFGSAKQIDGFIASLGLPPRPDILANRGSSRVWAMRTPNGVPVLFVEADEAESIRKIMRPLPHYRSKSYVVFEGRRAIDRGVWPSTRGPLTKDFD